MTLETILLVAILSNIGATGFALAACIRPALCYFRQLECLVIGAILTTFFIWLVFSESLSNFINVDVNLSLLIAIPLGLMIIFFEYFIEAVWNYFKSGTSFTKPTIYPFFADAKISALRVILMILIIILEEVLLRWFVFSYSISKLGLSFEFVIFISAVLYGFNHLNFGLRGLILKTLGGLIYGLIFFASKFSIMLVVLVHLTQNFTLLALSHIALLKNEVAR